MARIPTHTELSEKFAGTQHNLDNIGGALEALEELRSLINSEIDALRGEVTADVAGLQSVIAGKVAIQNIRLDADNKRLVATDVGVKTVAEDGASISIEEFYSDVETGEATSKVKTISSTRLGFEAISENEIAISSGPIDESIVNAVAALAATINEILESKANIFIRLAQGITEGNNIKGIHIQPKAPFDYHGDWQLLTAGNVKLTRTNNDLVYTDATGADHILVDEGEILDDNYIITDEFFITENIGPLVNINLLYRWFDMQDFDQRSGLLSALLTEDKSSLVNAINSLYNRVSALLTSTELEGSPFSSYADFVAAYPETETGRYAYVTFTDDDIIPPTWTRVQPGDSWRIDGGTTAFSPTSNMTAAITVILADGAATDALPAVGQHTVSDTLQVYRNNLKYVIQQLTTHIGRTDNPHSVTALQVGLENVANLAPADMPISSAAQNALDNKQGKITSTGATNLLTAPAQAGGNPGTKAIADFATAAQGTKADNAQVALTATGNTNLLTAPANAGAQPGTKAISDFVQVAGTQEVTGIKTFDPGAGGQLTVGTVGITPIRNTATQLGFLFRNSANNVAQMLFETNGATGRALTWRTSTDNGVNWSLSYAAQSIPAITTLNYATLIAAAPATGTALIFRYSGALGTIANSSFLCVVFNANGTYFQGLAIDYATGESVGIQITSQAVTANRTPSVAKSRAMGTGAIFSFQRSGNTVFAQCSGRATNAALASWDTLVTIPTGYRPSIATQDEDSIWVKGSVNGVIVDFQIFSNGVLRSSSAIPNGSAIILGATWITDNAMVA
ncbi:hypothetical protein LQZ19_08825 [Treponema primitia]|uniref:hypothetical protein n=1 Tax=Treponema primitia TaxID=88058 RepID=UPI0039809FB8